MKKAILSVSDKTGIVPFAQSLVEAGYELYSTGGTFRAIDEAGVKVTSVSELTQFEEIMDGRVKTLHPAVHGGILADRDKPEHLEQLKGQNIDLIDMVVVNLYPFKETVKIQTSLKWTRLKTSISVVQRCYVQLRKTSNMSQQLLTQQTMMKSFNAFKTVL